VRRSPALDSAGTLGLRVTGAASTSKLDLVHSIGAHPRGKIVITA
jgi:hypothetical protein